MHITILSTRRLLGRMAGLAAAAAIALPAQATLVQGDWDPAYGAPFTNLGWRGTSTIFVPATCLAESGLIANDGVACGLATVVSATVEFYALSDTAPIPATVETLNFTGATEVENLFITAGVVTAFGLNPLSRVASTSVLADIPGTPGNAFFELDLTVLVDGGLLGTRADLPWYRFSTDSDEGGTNATPASVAFRTVPLPGTLALALAGLFAAVALRRR